MRKGESRSASKNGAQDQLLVLGFRSTAMLMLSVVAIGGLGTLAAYSWSDAWIAWSGRAAWVRDVIRLAVAAALCLFGLWAMGGITKDGRRASLQSFALSERIAALALGILLVVLVPMVLGPAFQLNLLKRGFSLQQVEDFSEIWLPYFPYYLYMLAVWVGTVFPLVLMVSRRWPHDMADYRKQLALLRSFDVAKLNTSSPTDVELLALRFENLVACLKKLAERYIPVVLVIALILVYEQLTTSRLSVTDAALEIGKAGLWFLLGPVTLAGIILVVTRYENSVRVYEKLLDDVIGKAVTKGADPIVLQRARELREALTWDRSPGSFVLSVVKSGTIAVPLMLGLVAYVLETLSSTGKWVFIFIPESVQNWLSVVYCVGSQCK